VLTCCVGTTERRCSKASLLQKFAGDSISGWGLLKMVDCRNADGGAAESKLHDHALTIASLSCARLANRPAVSMFCDVDRQTGSRLKSLVAGVVEGTMQLVVDPLADALLKDHGLMSHCGSYTAAAAAAAAPDFSHCSPAVSSSIAAAAAGTQSQQSTGRWDLVFSRQSRQRAF
jgi:hypothetical protein